MYQINIERTEAIRAPEEFSVIRSVKSVEYRATSLKELARILYSVLSPSEAADVIFSESALCHLSDASEGHLSQYLQVTVTGSTNRPLSVDELYRWGKNQEIAERKKRYSKFKWNRAFAQWNGEGPVPRTGRSGGKYRWHRHPATTAERRANQPQLRDEMEPSVRSARQSRSLPNAWDDVNRGWQRSWKTQFRGRKSWDRG